jgi:hypothetical protein
MKNNKILELALMTSVYTNALNEQDMTSYNPTPREHKSTLNKKQSSKRRAKNNQAKKSRKANRK